MELLDVLDENGKPTGKTKPRSEVHRDGDWHRAAHVWIMNSHNELLIQKRAGVRKYWPNRWSVSVGGHIGANEDSRTSVAREVREELGLHCLPSELEFLFTATKQDEHNGIVENEFLDVYLLVRNVDTSTLSLEDGEVAETRWVNSTELEASMKDGRLQFVPEGDEYEKLFAVLRKRAG